MQDAKLVITINLENDAFGDTFYDARHEVKRLLGWIGYKWDKLSSEERLKLMDINGNSVGMVEIQR